MFGMQFFSGVVCVGGDPQVGPFFAFIDHCPAIGQDARCDDEGRVAACGCRAAGGDRR